MWMKGYIVYKTAASCFQRSATHHDSPVCYGVYCYVSQACQEHSLPEGCTRLRCGGLHTET